MSEKLSKNPEFKPDVLSQRESDNTARKIDGVKSQSPENIRSEKEKNATAARAEINTITTEIDRSQVAESLSQEKSNSDVLWNSRELKEHTYNQTLNSARNKLSKPEKTLSKVVHKPIIEKASDAMSNTVARPSGVLFGGVFSFIGSLASYLLAKKLGGELKYSVFAVFFVGGFIFGLLVELVIRILRNRSLK